jgi:hypothetical protein
MAYLYFGVCEQENQIKTQYITRIKHFQSLLFDAMRCNKH